MSDLSSITIRCALTSAALPDLRRYIDERHGGAPPEDLARRWREARETYRALSEHEAGCADDCAVLPVPDTMRGHVDELLGSPILNQTHEAVPVSFGLVDVEAMVSSAIGIDEDRLAAVLACLDQRPDDATIAACCLSGVPLERAASATDAGVTGTKTPRVMHAAFFRGRILLLHGHHRALALRSRGIGYLPCLISVCADLDDVIAACPTSVVRDWQRYFEMPRPPLLRDFDRRKLTLSFSSTRTSLHARG
jgi:hypothetical protein